MKQCGTTRCGNATTLFGTLVISVLAVYRTVLYLIYVLRVLCYSVDTVSVFHFIIFPEPVIAWGFRFIYILCFTFTACFTFTRVLPQVYLLRAVSPVF